MSVPQGPRRPPRGGWVQVTLALLLFPVAVLAVGAAVWQSVQASSRADTYAAAAGRTDVLTGVLDRVDVSPLAPVSEGHYLVDVPGDAPVPEAGGQATVRLDQRWGLPPSEGQASRVQLLVTYVDDPVDAVSARNLTVLEWVPEGSVELAEVTPDRADQLRGEAAGAHLRTGLVAAVSIAVLLGLVVRAVQRSRVRRAVVQQLRSPRPSAWPPPRA